MGNRWHAGRHAADKGCIPRAEWNRTQVFRFISNKLFFAGKTAASGKELWVSDGTADGTMLFKDLNPSINPSLPQTYIEYKNKLYFSARNEAGVELCVSDGTVNGTELFLEINSGTQNNGDSECREFFIYNNTLFFSAFAQDTWRELWSCDGTLAGTKLFIDFNTANQSQGSGNPTSFINFNGKLFFIANNSTINFSTIRESDGTVAGYR